MCYLRLSLLALACCSLTAVAQSSVEIESWSGDPEVSLKIDTRFDGQINTFCKDHDGNRQSAQKGFKGSYMLLCLNGSINPHFGYSFRYRLYKDNGTPSEFFNATDWLYLAYRPDDHWTFTAGKEAVRIGTMEYDLNPIDVFFASDFWNHVNPWQPGVGVSYNFSPANAIHLQVTNSTFSEKALDGLMAYNFMWTGHVAGWWQVMNSVNMIEYTDGRYINYIALGNRLNLLRDRLILDVDYINRYGGHHTPFFTDFTIAAKADVNISSRVTIFAKGGYDQNKSQDTDTPAERIIDRCVVPGTDRIFYGCGIEYFPIVTNRSKLRLHAYWNSSNSDPRCNTFTIGLRWQMDLINLKIKSTR